MMDKGRCKLSRKRDEVRSKYLFASQQMQPPTAKQANRCPNESLSRERSNSPDQEKDRANNVGKRNA